MTNSLAPKKPMSKTKKVILWVGGSIVGLLVALTVLGLILNAADPEGMEKIRAEQENERVVKEAEKAEAQAAKESAEAVAAGEKARQEEAEAARQEADKVAAESAKAAEESENAAQESAKAEDESKVKAAEESANAAREAEKNKAEEAEVKKQAEAKAAEEAAKNDPMRLIAEASGVKDVVVTKKGGVITASFPIQDNFSMRLIQVGAQSATVDILRAASEHAPAKYDKVLVLGGMDMQDAYGEVTEGQKVLQAEYEKATVEKINYDNVISENIWELRDFGFVHQVLREKQ